MNTTTLEIIGRDEELATLRTFLHGTAPGALVLTGEPGVGKTTIWRAGVEAAKEMSVRVLEAVTGRGRGTDVVRCASTTFWRA